MSHTDPVPRLPLKTWWITAPALDTRRSDPAQTGNGSYQSLMPTGITYLRSPTTKLTWTQVLFLLVRVAVPAMLMGGGLGLLTAFRKFLLTCSRSLVLPRLPSFFPSPFQVG